MMASNPVLSAFEAAAADYDQAAVLQQQVAAALVNWAATNGIQPHTCLDIGSGTGLVAKAIHSHWPHASITCFDASPAMLAEAKRKMPFALIRRGNATHMDIAERYDAIFSSMLLHWLPDPLAVLRHWQKHLQPRGKLFVAVPIVGSFAEWRALCRHNDMADGLRSFPDKYFAMDLATRCQEQSFPVQHNTATEFLHSIKNTGAATPRAEHRPGSAAELRRLLNDAPQPFCVTCQMVFLEIAAQSDP